MTLSHPTFQSAIVRPPASNFATGLTTQSLGAPSFEKALQQHAAYCQGAARLRTRDNRAASRSGLPPTLLLLKTPPS